MKYIRTEDGRIIKSLTEIKEAYDKVPIYIYTVMTDGYKHCCNIQRDFVEKLADTIEELCDWIVYRPNGKIRYLLESIDNQDLCFDYEILDFENWYGALDTDKGLIYVAKMNEKGELELL